MTLFSLGKIVPNWVPTVGASLALVFVAGLFSGSVSAAEPLQTKNEIINLMLCYGTGTDTFGDASNPDSFNDGLDIYEQCFTPDAVFQLWPAGTDFGGPAPVIVDGPENWAHFVADGLTGDSLGQHMLSNFIVDVNGDTGTLKAYLNATRATYDANGNVINVAVANGTYTLQVERVRRKWMVNQLDLKLISFVNHFSAP